MSGEGLEAFIFICVFAVIVAIPVTIGTVLHLRDNKRHWGRYLP